ncbi:fimbria/pilus outer membrane usher protein [Klebsiella sp. MISC125]|uniref:fimbria/pilus outer membrane usher protein n=1 Tax=Klebsiella sp. MISC125 TaxID=2755386 RepID=UPI003DA7DD05
MNICKLAASGCGLLLAYSASATEFNLNVLDKSMRNSVDVSLLKNKPSVLPGDYFVSIAINKTQISSGRLITWAKQGELVEPCIPVDLAEILGLKDEFYHSLPVENGCVNFHAHPEITFTLDLAKQQLNIAIPQAWVAWKANGWMPPSTWNDGVAGFLLDYNLFASTWRPDDGGHTENINAYGTSGFNLGAWRLRSDYQLSQTSSETSTENSRNISRTYLFRPLSSIGAKLTLGETDLSSNIFDGFSYTGVSLISDDRMLPWELRGYAPQISGVAQTNATVTVKHSGRIIYQAKVAPGPFIITDLNQSVQGTLDVEVTEEDGRVNTFQVSAASTPFLTRKGQVRYKITSGRMRPDLSHGVVNDTFISSEASWGALSNTSLYGGVLAAGNDYRSAAVGIGQNMLWLGALSFDITHAASRFDNGQEDQGSSYRLNYSKRFDTTDSQVSLAAYRFSEKTFHSYANFIDHQYHDSDTQDEKQTISLSVSQPIEPLNMNLYVSALRQMWWDGDSSTSGSVTAGFNMDIGDWKNISLTTTFSTTHYEESDNDNQVYVSVSIPFGYSQRLNYDMRNSDNTSHTVSWYDSSDPRNTWGVSAGAASERPDNGAQFRTNYQHQSSVGDLQLSGSYVASDYTSASASWNGSFTATRHGAAFHRHSVSNEPRLMVSTDGIADIPVQGDANKTNIFGYAVVPMISSYQPTTIAVNLDSLPDGVTVAENTLRETWTEGAIGYKTLASRAGQDVNVLIRTADGKYPPLGAVIQDGDGKTEIGMVSEEGHAWLSGVNGGQEFNVQWGASFCRISLPDSLTNLPQRLMLPCH